MINRSIVISFLFFWIGFFGLNAQNPSAHFTQYPSLTPDGQTLFFTYDGDIWKVGIQGGTAQRITGMQGDETHAKVSPDGKWLAFSANQYGNKDVYILPLEGGETKQLTFHEANDEVASWSWDSKEIYFTSNRYNRVSTYKISVDGGTPERVFDHYFNTIHDFFPHPKTGELFFNYSWESYNFATRQGYRGPYSPNIQSYQPETKVYKRYTDWEGKDFGTTIDRDGNIYFLSDEGNDFLNLYTFKNEQKTALTSFKEMLLNPSVSADGKKIVFEKGFQIWSYDVASGKTEWVPIQIYGNNQLLKEQNFNVVGNISTVDISSDKKKLAFISKGRMFVGDVEGKFIKEIDTDPSERVLEVYWLKGDKELIYNQTKAGFTNWFKIAADGKPTPKQLTDDQSNNRLMSFDPKKEKAVYLRGRNDVQIMDLKSFSVKTLAQDELWGFQNDRPSFSPDGKNVVFTARRNFETDIMMARVSDGKVYNLTQTGVSESDPTFSPDGKYLYFISDRREQAYPYGMQNAKLYRLKLSKFDEAFRSVQFDSLFVEKSEDKKDKKKNKKEDKKESAKELVMNIELEGLMDRIESVGPRFGNQYSVDIIQDGKQTHIIFTSNHEGGKRAIYVLTEEDFEKSKTKKVQGVELNRGWELASAGNKHILLAGGKLFSLNLKSHKAEALKMTNHSFSKNLDQEFKQMFDEVWANMGENYYHEDFNGLDWEEVRSRYAQYLPYVQSRDNLRKLLNDMLGELNTSHYGFNSSGKEERKFHKYYTAETGIEFDPTQPYVVKRIIANGAADFESVDVKAGDVLVAVNGKKVDPKLNREAYLSFPKRPEELLLTFSRNGKENKVLIHPDNPDAVKTNLYDEWIADNARKVGKDGKKRIGYVHMKNMTGPALVKFEQDMVKDSINRDGLILDLRYNTGGNVHDKVLQFLSQRPYLQWKYREGKMSPQPDFAPAAKPIVLLINEQTLSDGEMTTAGFKALGLGTVVGIPTYRWIIFTSSKSLVDGSSYRLPSWGCYTLEGDDLEKVGVEPDIYIDTDFKHRLNGEDPQLDKAIELILEKVK